MSCSADDRPPPTSLVATDPPTIAPVPRQVVLGLRREAYRMLRSDPRRVDFPTVLHLGRLDRWPAEVHACEVPRAPTRDWAVAVAEALLLDRVGPPGPDLWLTRPGAPEPDHLDDRWDRACREVAHDHGLAVPALYVVTRTGWSRHADGEGQRWRRLRLVLPTARHQDPGRAGSGT